MTNQWYPHIFTPGKIGSLELSNRLIVPAMATAYANPDGTVSDQLIAYHERRAQGGWGLVITEDYTVRDRAGAFRSIPGLWSDAQISGNTQLTDTVHAAGGKIAVQLYHAGRQAPSSATGQIPVGPSPIPDPAVGEIPHELTTGEIQEIIHLFASAAERAKRAGFDAIEIHGAHGYLISQFLSPFSNKRTDAYGGCLENRVRLSREVIRALRKKVGSAYPLIFRMSVEELVYGGLYLEDSKIIARWLENEGIDAIHASVGVGATQHYTIAPASKPHGWIVDYAAALRSVVKIPVITVNRITHPDQAEIILEAGKADFVAMGRASLADPDLPKKARGGKTDEINHCIGCVQRCIGFLKQGKPIGCLVNPACGREMTFALSRTGKKKKVLVAGGGPAGMEAALVAAHRGHEVLLYEKNDRLGGLWNLAAIPPGKEEYNQLTVWQRTELERAHVKVTLNTAVDAALVKRNKPDALIVASGSPPVSIAIPGLSEREAITSNQVLAGRASCGKKVLVVGGGYGGSQTAAHLAVHGHSVTLITKSLTLAPTLESINRFYLMKLLEEFHVAVVTGASVERAIPGGVKAIVRGRKQQFTGFDTVVFVDRLCPDNSLVNSCTDLVKEIRVIGDAHEVMDAGSAVLSGYEAGLTV